MPCTKFHALRLLLLVSIGAAMVVLGGCSGCEPRSCPETPCAEGAYCAEGVCYLESEGCVGCAGDEHCFRGGCVPDGTQCGAGEVYCDPTLPLADGSHCVDWDGQGGEPPLCSGYCEENGTCPSTAVCFALQSGSATSCNTPTACPTGELCVQGRCRTTACRPSECEGILTGDPACTEKYRGSPQFPDGAKCQTLDSGANYCLPAGRREIGQTCTDIDTASQNNEFTRTCELGLTCVDGLCEVPCRDDDGCEGAESCIGVDDARVADGVGYCADACQPFTTGACEGGTCVPISAEEGTCSDAGERDVGDSCTPGGGNCAAGTICVEYAAANPAAGLEQQARCQPLCDVTVAEANSDGTIDPEAQDARDDTCPQPEAAPASLRMVHVAETLGAVDIYRRGSDQPIVEGLGFEATVPEASAADWLEVEPGQYQLDILEQGAPRSDLPLATTTVALGEGQGRTVVIGPPSPTASDDATATAFEHRDAQSSATEVRVVHMISDADDVDIVAIAEGADIANPDARTLVGASVGFGAVTAFADVGTGRFDVLVYPEGVDRGDRANAVLEITGLEPTGDSIVYLRGTLDDTDFFDAGIATVVGAPAQPQSLGQGSAFTCVAVDGRAYGYCQQLCPRGPSDFGTDVCQGTDMGCAPREFPDRGDWETVCRPHGARDAQQPCDPSIAAGQCGEGLYCLEYGNTAEHVSATGQRGLCTALCATDPDAETDLSCAAGQSCQSISFADDFEVGRCGFECAPNAMYSDASCPAGLRSCLPVSSLEGGSTGQGQATPQVTREQSFCSQSGDISPGSQCAGFDCAPGSECLYERSVQTDLVSTLVSQYFAGGSTPTCHRQCDPFDGDSSQFECGAGQTCLFNFPWSAEVGHCASIAEDLEPGAPCNTPGLSCGEDSVCVQDGEIASCFRFCDYLGPDAQGALSRSTCPSGYECTPFVRDLGICSRPQ